MRSASWEGMPGSAVSAVRCWPESVLAVWASQSRVGSLAGVGASLLAEVRVLRGQFSDEGGQTGVVRVLGSFHAQLRRRCGRSLPSPHTASSSRDQ